MKASVHHFPEELFIIMPYKVFQTFESMDEILKCVKCDHANESY